MNEATRAWIYRGIGATVPLAVAYGLIADQTAPLWIAAAGAWLGVGLAVGNTTTKGDN